MDISSIHSNSNFAHCLINFVTKYRRWFLFGMSTDVIFQFTLERVINE